jgi:hypothetical protein
VRSAFAAVVEQLVGSGTSVRPTRVRFVAIGDSASGRAAAEAKRMLSEGVRPQILSLIPSRARSLSGAPLVARSGTNQRLDSAPSFDVGRGIRA